MSIVSILHKSHNASDIPASFFRRNVHMQCAHCCCQSGALWDMGLVHCEILASMLYSDHTVSVSIMWWQKMCHRFQFSGAVLSFLCVSSPLGNHCYWPFWTEYFMNFNKLANNLLFSVVADEFCEMRNRSRETGFISKVPTCILNYLCLLWKF